MELTTVGWLLSATHCLGENGEAMDWLVIAVFTTKETAMAEMGKAGFARVTLCANPRSATGQSNSTNYFTLRIFGFYICTKEKAIKSWKNWRMVYFYANTNTHIQYIPTTHITCPHYTHTTYLQHRNTQQTYVFHIHMHTCTHHIPTPFTLINRHYKHTHTTSAYKHTS